MTRIRRPSAGARQPSPDPEPAPGTADRDRYVDLLRLLSISVVVLGHWLIAVVTLEDGRVATDVLLRVAPWTAWTTWVLQVVPVFFLVGGYANRASLGRAAARPGGAPEWPKWIRARATRLLRPLLPLLAVWVPLTAALAPTDGALLETATWTVTLPLWFLAVYLGVVALAPLTHALHRRHGPAPLVAFVGLAVLGDVLLRIASPRPGWLAHAGWTNYLWVWAAIHQAGYHWRDGRVPRRTASCLALAAAGYGTLTLLTRSGAYPLALVDGEGPLTNTSPPSVALLALAAGQLGLVLLVRRPVDRWLRRPHAWKTVIAGNQHILTLYLWHMTALVAASATLVATGAWPDPEPGSTTWWALRPPWILTLAATLALLVTLFRRFERPTRPRPRGRTATLLGAASTCTGLTLLVRHGTYFAPGPLGLPVLDLALLAAGFVLLGVGPAQR